MPVTELQIHTMSSLQPTDESNSDAALLRRYFSNGDREAMDELFKRHAGTAYRLAYADVENAADAEEIVQIAFLKVLLNETREIDNVRGWIMSIVVDTCRNKVREESRLRKRQKAASADRSAVGAPSKHFQRTTGCLCGCTTSKGCLLTKSDALWRFRKAPSASRRIVASSRFASRSAPPDSPLSLFQVCWRRHPWRPHPLQ